jgi:hypothetical protein
MLRFSRATSTPEVLRSVWFQIFIEATGAGGAHGIGKFIALAQGADRDRG